MRVLVDAVEGDVAIARSAADAPEIDGVVRMEDARDLRAGEFATANITRSDAHDLTAKRAP